MEKIPLPTKIEFLPGAEKNTSIINIEPFFPGYGTTVGNSLRRILLSSLPGAAVTAFKVKGALHEFSGVNDVKEDLVEISLNLKQLRLKLFSDQTIRLELNAKGEKMVTAGDISPNSDVEIANPELHIATLTSKNAELNMEFIVSKGRGYITTESRESENLEVGMIAIDSIFSPVKNVGYRVENVRVGQMTNWDRLILEIKTDGTVTPKDALNYATKILIEQLSFIDGSVIDTETNKPDVDDEIPVAIAPENSEAVAKEEAAAPAIEEKKEPKKRGRPKKKKDNA